MQTIVHPIRRATLVAADREGLVCGDERRTFEELAARMRRLHTVLDDLETARGDRVALLLLNSHAFAELYCAVPASGRLQVPLNFRWAPPELAYALEDAGAKVLFTDQDPGPLAELVERVVRVDTGEYEALLAAAEETEFDASAVDEGDTAGLFYTGGTTGASKGVMLSHRNLLANGTAYQMTLPMAPDDVYLVVAPMFHAAGSCSVLQCLYLGVKQVLIPRFSPEAALDAIAAEGVTHTLAVPSMLAAMTEEQLVRPREVGSLKAIAHGGSPVALEVLRRAERAFPSAELVELYGATETSPLVTVFRHEEDAFDADHATAAGQPMIGVEVAIRGAGGVELPIGEPGEVTVRGANVMQGYWNKPEQTSKVLRDGWYSTGDVGRMDKRGYLYLLDRSKDMIVTGGENVYCTEVEDALYRHPAVLEATVFGVPDDKWGEAVHAVVVPREDVDEVTLIAHCKGLIAGYKVPRGVTFQSEPLPKSGPGKVLKRQLRAPFWEGRERNIG